MWISKTHRTHTFCCVLRLILLCWTQCLPFCVAKFRNRMLCLRYRWERKCGLPISRIFAIVAFWKTNRWWLLAPDLIPSPFRILLKIFIILKKITIYRGHCLFFSWSGPTFPNRFTSKLRCIEFGYHAAFLSSLPSKYASSGVRLSRAVCGRSVL